MKHIALFLRDIYFNKRTGRLIFKQDDITKYFFFQEGELAQVKTNVPGERLGEILFKQERITEDVFRRIEEFIEPNTNIGEVLIAKGIVSAEDLADALTYQMRETTLNAYSSFDAEMVFQEREKFGVGLTEAKVSIPFLIEYGIRRMQFDSRLKDFMAEKVPIPKRKSFVYLLTDEEREILERISGTEPAEKIAGLAKTRPELFWKSLYLFYCLEIIDFRSEEEARAAAPRGRAEAPGPAEGRWRAQDKKDLPQIGEVLTFRESLHSRNYYEILGVERNAEDTEIKKAYFQLARKYHPDRFDRETSQAYREQIDEVFNAVTTAYRALSSPETRKTYDANVASAPPEEVQDVARKADIKFRQGRTLFQQDRFEDAVVLLEEAVRLRKNKGDYYLLLAMAESKIPAYTRKAEEDFLKAISMEPWNAEGHLGLAYLYKSEGLLTKAARYFQKAAEVDPDHVLARQEMETLMGGTKKKGLKSLLSMDLFGSKKKKKKRPS